MSILPIYLYDQPVLRKKAKPVRTVDNALVKSAMDMVATMDQADGIGLAANQVGLLQQIIVINAAAAEQVEGKPPLILLNPRVVDGQGSIGMEEGCLSLPGLREEVQRPEHVRVTYRDLDFKEQEIDASGLLARVLQHEIDHLNGVLFPDRLNAVKRKLLRGRLNKIRKGEVDVTYPVVVPALAEAQEFGKTG